jgi:hypothetical protein
VTVPGKVEADPFGSKKTLFLEVPNDKVFAGSNVTVTYELHRPNGDLVGSSNPANAAVTGSAPIELLPPFLVAPAVDPINVLAYPNGVTVRIEYLQALNGDKARLVEVNPPADAPQFPLVEFNSNKRVNTVLSQSFLAARQGQTIALRWNLNRDGGLAAKSPATTLNVLEIADGEGQESFETGVVEWKEEGTIMDFPNMTVTVIGGPVALNRNANVAWAPFITGNYFHLNVNETLRFTLKRPVRSIRFGLSTAIRTTALAECYDENMQPIKTQSTRPHEERLNTWVGVNETLGKKIKYLDITIKGIATAYLDNFSIFY